MKVHRCPERIFKMFDTADEEAKAKGRRAAIDWLSAQNPQVGDEAIMPNPDTGEEMRLVKDRTMEQ